MTQSQEFLVLMGALFAPAVVMFIVILWSTRKRALRLAAERRSAERAEAHRRELVAALKKRQRVVPIQQREPLNSTSVTTTSFDEYEKERARFIVNNRAIHGYDTVSAFPPSRMRAVEERLKSMPPPGFLPDVLGTCAPTAPAALDGTLTNNCADANDLRDNSSSATN
jgi:hypothetical protein